MNIHPDQVRVISFTNHELVTIMSILRKIVPEKDLEDTVVNIVNRISKTLRQ